MKKIKTFIIHLLGGYTKEQAQYRFAQGVEFALEYHIDFMEKLNGKPAEEWCRIAYDEITKNLQSVRKTITKIK